MNALRHITIEQRREYKEQIGTSPLALCECGKYANVKQRVIAVFGVMGCNNEETGVHLIEAVNHLPAAGGEL
jgi:hypothetical protein